MKLEKVKTIEGRIWILCKNIIRAKYGIDKCYICGKEVTELKKLHTGHLFKKGSLPLQLKYDLRLLRPCCSTCNLFLDGNESWYMVNMLEKEGIDYINKIVYDIRNTQDITSVPLMRSFLLDLELQYSILWQSYQRMAKPVN